MTVTLASVAASLQLGREVRFKARGKSMEPRVHDLSIVTVRPLAEGELPQKGQVVLARVKGQWYLHLVKATRDGQVQISNNRGYVNGWTALANVVGVLREEGGTQ